VHENDRVGLEQLARYGLRPALSLERLSKAGDGTYLYEMKRRFSDGRQTLRFAPRELLLRLCALVPPRGFHMVRYHGIFAPHARGRFALTGRGMHDCAAELRAAAERVAASDAVTDVLRSSERPPAQPPLSAASMWPPSTIAKPKPLEGATWKPPDDATRARRLEWSLLMKRSYALDVLCCPRCQGPMRLIAVIDNELVARRILLHLGLMARAPPRGPLPGIVADPEPSDALDGVDLIPVETC
jgi:Putative transposase